MSYIGWAVILVVSLFTLLAIVAIVDIIVTVEVDRMAKHRVRCPICERLFTAETDEEVYRKLEAHIKNDHPEET